MICLRYAVVGDSIRVRVAARLRSRASEEKSATRRIGAARRGETHQHYGRSGLLFVLKRPPEPSRGRASLFGEVLRAVLTDQVETPRRPSWLIAHADT